MSFVAAISSPNNIATWSRACVALAGVSDQISFTVSDSSLTMLAVSSSKTTHGEVHFGRGYFQEIALDGQNIVPDGLGSTGSGPTYSFVVSSRHLVMSLKNSDAHSLNYVCLRVECHTDTPAIRQYKLNVEILTKRLVLKKYQIAFQPASVETTTIPAQYDALLAENDIYKFEIETAIVKSFLDTAHMSTEDFAVEVKANNIVFTAYTKQVMKDRDYLKQPMSVAISMAVADLCDSNLAGSALSLTFRLRDFRTFVGLLSSFRSDVRGESFTEKPKVTFDALFQAPGDPILFQHSGPDVTVNFIQMTTDESGLLSKQDTKNYVIHAPIVSRKRASEVDTEEPRKTKKKSREKELPRSEEPEAYDVFGAFEPSQPRVTYGESGSPDPDSRESRKAKPSKTPKTPKTPEPPSPELAQDTDYSTSDQQSDTEFGPTQAREVPKSLFG